MYICVQGVTTFILGNKFKMGDGEGVSGEHVVDIHPGHVLILSHPMTTMKIAVKPSSRFEV